MKLREELEGRIDQGLGSVRDVRQCGEEPIGPPYYVNKPTIAAASHLGERLVLIECRRYGRVTALTVQLVRRRENGRQFELGQKGILLAAWKGGQGKQNRALLISCT